MAYYYSNPKREDDPHALPDVEIFYLTAASFLRADDGTWMFERMREIVNDAPDGLTDTELDALQVEHAKELTGWYYWFCSPGYLPEGDAYGPYETEEAAIDAMREQMTDYFDDDTEA